MKKPIKAIQTTLEEDLEIPNTNIITEKGNILIIEPTINPTKL